MGVSQSLGLPFLGVPIIRIIVYWGLCWVPLILGNYYMDTCEIAAVGHGRPSLAIMVTVT